MRAKCAAPSNNDPDDTLCKKEKAHIRHVQKYLTRFYLHQEVACKITLNSTQHSIRTEKPEHALVILRQNVLCRDYTFTEKVMDRTYACGLVLLECEQRNQSIVPLRINFGLYV